ncbi:MAG TPA: site-specific DNA-methyltransferase [Bryobacteraceae bacterium]|nr:site-specific DNA-methyltransferase [Bryobacteraceae bacterium]
MTTSAVPVFTTEFGALYRGDCLAVLPQLEGSTVDLVFADPPFNLGKSYASGINDRLPETAYLDWCKRWIDECVRLLKPGGSFFLYNLPKWNLALGAYLNERLTFRHWVAIEMTYSLPIVGRLYPSHYSLLYYCKGPKPAVFTPDRLPIVTCPHCHRELKDYGGYKDKMNPEGVNLTDVWKDIPPVRHRKFKRREEANELSIKLLDRVVRMASKPGNLVLDPFGGSGTTYLVSELMRRRWIGTEIGPIDQIVDRLAAENQRIEQGFLDEYRSETNCLFPENVQRERERRGIWVPGNIPKGRARNGYAAVPEQSLMVLEEPAGSYRARKRKPKSA